MFKGGFLFLSLLQILLMKKILITGGAGYIGSHTVVSLIENGYLPVIVDDYRNSNPKVIDRLRKLTDQDIFSYPVDCSDPNQMEEVFSTVGDISGVIHFAAYKSVGESVFHPAKYFQNNIHGLTVLCQTMNKFGVKDLVFSSSCTVYGEPEGKAQVTEESPIQEAASPYGYTKQACERLLQYLSETEENPLKVVLLRYFNPIGAHPSSLIGELPIGVPANLVPYVTQTAAGLRKELTVFGDNYSTPDGTCIRDYIHVCDLAEAHVKSIEFLKKSKQPLEVFNVGTGTGTSVLEIIRTFEEVSAKKLPYKVGQRRPGDVKEIYANVDKIQKTLNWRAKYTVKDALKHAWEWEKTLH